MNIPLWHDQPALQGFNEGCPSLTPYLLEGEGPFPAVIVCPGGGYTHRAGHEGEPVAKWLNAIGISAFVLHYRVSPAQYPSQLHDAQRAIRMIRHRGTEWNIDPERIGMLGFSAGGHLASMAGTHFDNGNPQANDPIERYSSRPDALVLCYPLITMGEFTNVSCKSVLMGERQNDRALIELLSSEKQVTEETPPTFMWITADDPVVQAENCLMFATALRKARVSFEMHLFESGPHGLGLASGDREAQAWTKLCEAWLKSRDFLLVERVVDEYTKVGQLLADDCSSAVLERYLPDLLASPKIDYIKAFSLKSLFNFSDPMFTDEKMAAILKDLKSGAEK
ncbi:esterase [Paenibacillus ferrarius]|uniref:Esterase n=1 Tax=Paenibacillus ferrarius TaxID=1469647 RepID=A0A1V4HCK9_9BACL|nr:alpha/beta hydrolase [Paenibacillus ferrarius]OPH51135.1 esterase [Paenibacillus ferrarius]